MVLVLVFVIFVIELVEENKNCGRATNNTPNIEMHPQNKSNLLMSSFKKILATANVTNGAVNINVDASSNGSKVNAVKPEMSDIVPVMHLPIKAFL